MDVHKNPLISVNLPAAVQFEANKELQTKGLLFDGDSGFLRYNHRFVRPKGDVQANRDLLNTLLATQGQDNSECVEKLISENISYRDLGSLTDADLELMGFAKSQQREELLEFFAQLPNQDPSYEHICNLKEALTYNRKIVNNANQHLETMRSSLAAANYKLQIMPPDDVIVGEKSFASRFVLEALNELYGVTDDIDQQIKELGKVNSKPNHAIPASDRKPKKLLKKSQFTPALMFSTITFLGIIMAVYYWRMKH